MRPPGSSGQCCPLRAARRGAEGAAREGSSPGRGRGCRARGQGDAGGRRSTHGLPAGKGRLGRRCDAVRRAAGKGAARRERALAKAGLRLPRSCHGISYIDENGNEDSHERAHVQGLRRHRKISAEEVHRWQLRRFASTSSGSPTPRPARSSRGAPSRRRFVSSCVSSRRTTPRRALATRSFTTGRRFGGPTERRACRRDAVGPARDHLRQGVVDEARPVRLERRAEHGVSRERNPRDAEPRPTERYRPGVVGIRARAHHSGASPRQ